MKKLLIPFLTIGVLVANMASAELNVLTVDMEKLLNGYYKYEDAKKRFESISQEFQTEAQDKEKSFQTDVESYQALEEELNNPMLSDDAKAEKEASVQQKQQELQQKQMEIRQWLQQKQRELQRREQEVLANLVDEINKVVQDIALKKHSADLVFDTSSISRSGVPTVIYSDSGLDITDQVLKELNKDAPTE